MFYFFLIKSNLIIQLLEMYEFKKFDEVVKKKDIQLKDYTGSQKTIKIDTNTDLIQKSGPMIWWIQLSLS